MADDNVPGDANPGQGTGAPATPTEAAATSNADAPNQPQTAKDEPSRFDKGRDQGKKDLLRQIAEKTGGRVKSIDDLASLVAALEKPEEPEAVASESPPEPAADHASALRTASANVTRLQQKLDRTSRHVTERERERDTARNENAALRQLIVRSQIRAAAASVANEHALEDFESYLASRVTVDLEPDEASPSGLRAVMTVRDGKSEATDQSLTQLVESMRQAKPHWCRPIATPGAGSRPGKTTIAPKTPQQPNGAPNLRTTAGIAQMLTEALGQPRR